MDENVYLARGKKDSRVARELCIYGVLRYATVCAARGVLGIET